MRRRDLFHALVRLGERPTSEVGVPILTTTGLEPHPNPLTIEDAYHLLRRAGFGPTHQRALSLVGKTAEQAVDELLGATPGAPATTPGQWIDKATENPAGADLQTRFAIEAQWNTNMASLANWWIQAMAGDDSAIEKLTLFWSNHFTTEFSFDESYSVPQTLWRQYLMLRSNSLGEFTSFVLDVTLDNAMVWYLGGHFNERGKPNENYARELMELFTTGIGWYTEGDVKEAARTLTGWKASRFDDEPTGPDGIYRSYFDAARHDTGAKQFMGQTIAARTPDNNTAFQVKTEEIARLISIIHEQRPEAVSAFIADKLYRFFVYSSPTETNRTIVSALAQVFRSNNWNIRPVLRTLLSSAHFFDPAVRGSQLKSPLEFVAGVLRQFGSSEGNPQDWTRRMDQPVMDPPTVFGWPGYRSWISTNSYPVRRSFAQGVIARMTDAQALAFIQSFTDYTDIHKLVPQVVAYLLPVPISESRMENYVKAALQNAPDYDWPKIVEDAATAGQRIRTLLTAIARAPDFQLC
jgi:uncharacterized protein (DUF1800 family)